MEIISIFAKGPYVFTLHNDMRIWTGSSSKNWICILFSFCSFFWKRDLGDASYFRQFFTVHGYSMVIFDDAVLGSSNFRRVGHQGGVLYINLQLSINASFFWKALQCSVIKIIFTAGCNLVQFNNAIFIWLNFKTGWPSSGAFYPKIRNFPPIYRSLWLICELIPNACALLECVYIKNVSIFCPKILDQNIPYIFNKVDRLCNVLKNSLNKISDGLQFRNAV